MPYAKKVLNKYILIRWIAKVCWWDERDRSQEGSLRRVLYLLKYKNNTSPFSSYQNGLHTNEACKSTHMHTYTHTPWESRTHPAAGNCLCNVLSLGLKLCSCQLLPWSFLIPCIQGIANLTGRVKVMPGKEIPWSRLCDLRDPGSPTRDRTQASCSESKEYEPLDLWEFPCLKSFLISLCPLDYFTIPLWGHSIYLYYVQIRKTPELKKKKRKKSLVHGSASYSESSQMCLWANSSQLCASFVSRREEQKLASKHHVTFKTPFYFILVYSWLAMLW